MTPWQRDRLCRYLRDLADKMELRDWTIMMSGKHPDDGNQASARATYGRKAITIKFSREFFDDDPEEQRQTCVHELLHAHAAMLDQVLWEATGSGEGKTKDRLLYDTTHLHLEYAIDAIADGWAKSLPLPPSFDQAERKARKGKADGKG